MNRMEPIAHYLEVYTAEQSGFETSRDYVSLSNAVMSEEQLYDQYIDGFATDHFGRLKCYKGLQMEKDLLRRLKEMWGDKIKLGHEIVAFNGLVKGHPDFLIDVRDFKEIPGDCKSVAIDEHLPIEGKLPAKTYCQLQGYMKYMGKPYGLAIYESRQTGKIQDYWIAANPRIQEQIHLKYSNVVAKING